MAVVRLRIEDVRCLESVDVELGIDRNYFYGANGAGKTSVLESIYLLGRGRSFRTRQIARLVRSGAERLSVFGEVEAEGARHRLGVGFAQGRLEVRIDGAAADGLVSLARAFPVHVIDPKLHRLIEAGPSERRRFLDAGVFHVEQDYLDRWRAYRRLLGQRNAALKTGVGGAELDVWTEPFVAAGDHVHAARGRYVGLLAESVRAFGQSMLGSDVELDYRPGWRKGLTLAEAVAESLDRDRTMGFSQVGPHRADLKIRFQAGEVRDAASRGQQKLVAAALVLGQVGLFETMTGRRGTLLIDDPAAELDAASLDRLLSAVGGLRAQLIMTALELRALRPSAGCPVFHVEQGTVAPMV